MSNAKRFFCFLKENKNIKDELEKNLEVKGILHIDKSEQSEVVLDELESLAREYNFEVDKAELEKFLNVKNNEIVELDEDDLANVAGGFGLSDIAVGLALLTGVSVGSGSISAFAANPDSSIPSDSSDTAVIQYYEQDDNQDNIDSADQTDTEKGNTFQDTTEAEIAFSLERLNSLPKKGDADFNKFLEITKIESLNENRENTVNHKDGTTETIKINEKEVYEQIKNTVEVIKQKVKSRTPEENMSEEDIEIKINNREVSKNYKLPQQMRIAKAIYRWVAKNIPYDDESIEKSSSGKSLRKPQDALFVFSQKKGICAGKANLVNLMMRLSGVPSSYIGSTEGKSGGSHAYNAIYLEDTTNNREGWTLIDSTWAAPDSDSNLQKTDKDKVENLIEGQTNYFDPQMVENYFNRTDDYAKEIEKMLDIPYQERTEMNDTDITELNQKIDSKLKELNENTTVDGVKFEKIEIFKDEYDLNVRYKTNLTKMEAAEIIKQVEAREKEQMEKARIKEKMNISCGLFSYATNNLSDDIYSDLNNINLKKDSNKSERSEEYCEKVKGICKDILRKYKITKKNLETISAEIQNEINKINPQYEDIVIFRDFNIRVFPAIVIDDEENKEIDQDLLDVLGKTSLSYDEAKMLVEQEQIGFPNNQFLDSMKVYFPGFYGEIKKDFTQANESILRESTHKISRIDSNKSTEDKNLNSEYKFQVDGVVYELDGQEGNSVIRMSGDWQNPAENVQIPSKIASLGMKFKIGPGVKSLILKGDETVDLSNAYQLEYIDSTNSNKYISENGILYEKNSDDSKGNLIYRIIDHIFSGGKIDNISYLIKKDDNNINEIKFYDLDISHENVRLPKVLTQFKKTIKIGYGIKSLILKGDETVDLSEAFGLEYIDATNSNKYISEDGILYEKNPDGSKGDLLYRIIDNIFSGGKVDNINYLIDKDDNNIRQILFYDFDSSHENIRLPKFLTQFNVPIKIWNGIESLILEGNEIVDLSQAMTVKSIDIRNSTRYQEKDGKLIEIGSTEPMQLPKDAIILS